jgi:hypothetical protein
MSQKKLQKFFELQAEENNCEVDDLWMKFNSIEVSDDETEEAKKKPKKASPKKVDDIEDPNNLSNGRLAVAKKAELVALCRYHELKIGGKMDELKDRLKEFAASKKGKASPAGKTSTKKEPSKGAEKEEKKKVSPPKKAGKKATPEVLKKIAPVQHRARKNKHGNYVLANYGLVMDDETQSRVIGVQADDGSVVALEETDIDTCKMLKLPYDLPDNLDTEADLDQTQVDGIEEEDHADAQINALAVAAKKKGKKVIEEDANEEEEQPEEIEEESEVEDEESEVEIVD